MTEIQQIAIPGCERITMPSDFALDPELAKATIAGRGRLAHFDKLLGLPAPSEHEQARIEHVKKHAEALGLEANVDAKGNLIIHKPANAGFSDKPTVVLQGHLDYIVDGEGNRNSPTNAELHTDRFMYSKDRATTLTADNGAGVSIILEEMERLANQETGEVYFIFTVEEEIGLNGAKVIDSQYLPHNKDVRVINIDSQKRRELCRGCAGGALIEGEIDAAPEEIEVSTTHTILELEIKGLKGGHSASYMGDKRGNAAKILFDTLLHEIREIDRDFMLSTPYAGKAMNAIPKEASCRIVVDAEVANQVQSLVERFAQRITTEEIDGIHLALKNADGVRVSCEEIQDERIEITSQQARNKLLSISKIVPHGVLETNPADDEEPFLSTNFALIRPADQDGRIAVSSHIRYAHAERRDGAIAEIRGIFDKVGIRTTEDSNNRFASWFEDDDSPAVVLAQDTAEKLFGERPPLKTTHGGLEMAPLMLAMEGNGCTVSAVSLGIENPDAHSNDEAMGWDSYNETALWARKMMDTISL